MLIGGEHHQRMAYLTTRLLDEASGPGFPILVWRTGGDRPTSGMSGVMDHLLEMLGPMVLSSLASHLSGPRVKRASDDAIAALPIVEVTSEMANQECGCSCAICLNDFEVGAEGVTRMPCKHLYHKACLLPWLESHNTCPSCRAEVEAQPQEEGTAPRMEMDLSPLMFSF